MLNYFYDPNNKLKRDPIDPNDEHSDEWHSPEEHELVDNLNDTLFHIGQSYEKKPAETLVCKFCGSTEFNVGSGSYYTAIRCPKCEWELNIHNG